MNLTFEQKAMRYYEYLLRFLTIQIIVLCISMAAICGALARMWGHGGNTYLALLQVVVGIYVFIKTMNARAQLPKDD